MCIPGDGLSVQTFKPLTFDRDFLPPEPKRFIFTIFSYGGIIRTYIVLLFISCARLFLFRRSFFHFYYLVRTTFLFRRSFYLFYYLVRTTFLFRGSFFLFYYLVRTTY